MESGSGSNPNPSWIYDVYLSFRGENTPASFVSHLKVALANAGVSVYRDSDELSRGNLIPHSVLSAIEASRISIIVFSEHYASSTWCLDELVKIMECFRTIGQTVLPVFYDVEPSDVGWQKGMFGEVFEALIQRMSVEDDKLMTWRASLTEASNLSGYALTRSRNESEGLQKVVDKVTALLDNKDLFVADHPVGVNSRVQDVIRLLNSQQSDDPLFLGIWGMGGLGKTTIAKAIYNQMRRDFEAKSILLNVKEVWEQNGGQLALQQRLLFDIYKTTKIKIDSVDSVDDKNKIRMHDLVRDMGREIIRQKSIKVEERSRLWLYKDIHEVLSKNTMLAKLKILNLSHSPDLKQIPDLSYLPDLEKLILKDCPRLFEVSNTIGHLNKISLINLKDCIGLHELPSSIYKLESLQTLILSGCVNINKLEEDTEQMKSLTTLIADKTGIMRVPLAIVRSKSIGYISLCGYEGFSRDVFPSIILSWMSPTNSILSHVETSVDISPVVLKDFQELQRLWVKYDSEAELNLNVKRILGSLHIANSEKLLGGHCQAHNPNMKNSLTTLLFQMGMNCHVADILKKSILQEMSPIGPGLLPSDNFPDWLTFSSESSSVSFEVPQVNGRTLKTIMCIVCYSSPDNLTSEGLENVMLINYSKITMQLYKKDALTSFEDDPDEWQRVVSNIEPGNKVKFVVAFEKGFIVKKTTVYLIFEELIDEQSVIDSGGDQESKSGSNPNPNWFYDVFLSFRGEDTRESFVLPLKAALENAGVSVYWETKELLIGVPIAHSLRAIEASRISIVVFSENYATSKWCLKELEKIMECGRTIGQIVVPLFYDVDPSDVRKQEGTFGKAFVKYEQRMSVEKDKLMGWRAALTEASDLSGFDLRSSR